ncbi:hypothetical protein HY249_00090 [Candidatus Azambacteria bacterium]|nr:hypothetical protein [Candidatus Azambacteria bacterium]
MLQFLKSKAYLLAALFLLLPSFASAHLKWFVNEEGELPSVPMEENTELYFIYWIIISAVIVLIGIFLEKRFPAIPKQIEYKLNSIKHKAASIFTIVIGLFLLIAAYKGFLFSDNLKNLGFLNSTLLGIETLVGFSFLLGLSVRVFSIVLIFLWTFGIAYVGLLNMFEAVWVLGAGIFALIYGREHFRITKLSGDLSNKFFLANEEYAFPIIRRAWTWIFKYIPLEFYAKLGVQLVFRLPFRAFSRLC